MRFNIHTLCVPVLAFVVAACGFVVGLNFFPSRAPTVWHDGERIPAADCLDVVTFTYTPGGGRYVRNANETGENPGWRDSFTEGRAYVEYEDGRYVWRDWYTDAKIQAPDYWTQNPSEASR